MDRLIGFDAQLLHDAVLTGINVFILFFCLSYLLFNPVRDVLEKRRKRSPASWSRPPATRRAPPL